MSELNVEALTSVLADVRQELVDVKEDLRKSNESLSKLKKSNTRFRNISIGLIISFTFDVVLTGYLYHNNSVLGDVQDKTTTSGCDLYSLIIRLSANPDPSQIDTPDKLKAYNSSMKVFRDNYNRLNCADQNK